MLTQVQIMILWHNATYHFLNQCSPKSFYALLLKDYHLIRDYVLIYSENAVSNEQAGWHNVIKWVTTIANLTPITCLLYLKYDLTWGV